MKSAAHQFEDKLLEFAYGELPQHEADAVDAHVRGCNRCSQSLSEIRGVRATMAQLPMEAAPDAGLESLLAYAEQAAKRSSAKTAPSIWKRFLMPLASLAALATVGVVGFRANQEFDTSPAAAIADTKVEQMARAEKSKATESARLEDQLAQKQQAQEVAVPPVVAAVAPQPDPALKNEPRQNNAKEGKAEEKNAALDELADSRAAQSRGDVWSPEPKVAPQSVAKREAPPKPKPMGNADVRNDEQVYRDNDYSNAAQRGGRTQALSKDVAPPAPPPPAQDKPSYGYGLGSPGGGSQGAGGNDVGGKDGAKGGLTGGESSPQGLSSSTAKMPPAPAKSSPSPVAEKPAEEQQFAEVKQKEEAKKRAKADDSERRAAEPSPAPVAAAPMPSTSMPSTPSKKLSKNDYGIRPQLGSSSPSSMGAESDDELVQRSDSLGVNNEAKLAERQKAVSRTQSLENARVASSRGDRLSEIRLAAQVLQAGATGYEKVEALKRICDAYEALGEVERADPFCDQLLQEFPATAAAKAVSDRRRNVQRAPAPAPKRPAAVDRKSMDFQEAGQPKPADAPAQAY